MGISYSVDPAARLVRLDYSGVVTFDDWAGAMIAVFRHPGYASGFAFLADRRLALPPSTDYIQRTVAFIRTHKRRVAGSRWALVFGSSATFGMLRLGQALAKDLPTSSCTFKSLEEAERWLREGAPPAA